MTFCSACGMRSHPDRVHLCTLEVLVALRAQRPPADGAAEDHAQSPA